MITKNKVLKAAFAMAGKTQKEVAGELSINVRTFYNKINLRKQANGHTSQFTVAERDFLSHCYGINKNEIE